MACRDCLYTISYTKKSNCYCLCAVYDILLHMKFLYLSLLTSVLVLTLFSSMIKIFSLVLNPRIIIVLGNLQYFACLQESINALHQLSATLSLFFKLL